MTHDNWLKENTDPETGELLYIGQKFKQSIKKIKNPSNYDPEEDSNPEHNYFPSQTIPEDTMSLREIVSRYVQGQPISGNSTEPHYFDEEELPDPKKMDLTELQDYIDDNRRIIQQAEEENKRLNAEAYERSLIEKYEKNKAEADKKNKPGESPLKSPEGDQNT